ncbi:phage virion morphogenesis protein [Giesbergeria anulus]|uniref:Phage virion morphogenesis (Putative tail completion) protein n=1 Tax=Giesbergeria anulus TaxID=180197 RepID=A0A1H9SIP5_9BURK|nr:phage virion morphogenesis protein [Giesbergeria anulus]SER71534.1 phage virion morphogenesis (putative tail completion) protein [Giesbergeria anulus]SER84821.1 phage virion morphogenesis (putative tail completion) protein [Giesbergeria anulus]
MITITIQDREVLATLQALTRRIGNMAPVLQAIGDDITERTKRRFETSTGPDGTPWEANSPTTMGIYSLRLGQGHRKKDGSLNKRGEARVAGKKPLIDTGELRRQIVPQVSNNVLTVTATPVYAAIHQFGGQAGGGHKVKIPARPYLPVKADGNLYPQEQALILETLQLFLTEDL